MEPNAGTVRIEIPKDLYEKIEKRVSMFNEEFKSVEEYVAFVLAEVVKEEEQQNAYTKEEEEEIKSRLKSLGYI